MQVANAMLICVTSAGNHEYDYRWSQGRRRSDPSGSGDPYEPDWGNYGALSHGHAGSQGPLRHRSITPAWSQLASAYTCFKLGPCVVIVPAKYCPCGSPCATFELRYCSDPLHQKGIETLPCDGAGNDSGGECGVTVANRFSMPGASTEANGLFTADMAAFGANGSASPGGEAAAALHIFISESQICCAIAVMSVVSDAA